MNRREILQMIPFAVPYMRTASAFSEYIAPSPIEYSDPEHPLSMQYTKKVASMLQWVKQNQSANLLEASYRIAHTVMKGHNVWCSWDQGHTPFADIFEGRNGKPAFLEPEYDFDRAKDGDLALVSFCWTPGLLEDIAKKDLYVVGAPAQWGGDAKMSEHISDDIAQLRIRPHADLWIETGVDVFGAMVDIPGSPYNLGPESGPLYGTLFWMMVADACRILAVNDYKGDVIGDEPPLKRKGVTWVDINAPLMDTYYSIVLAQLELIGSELGLIRKMAEMVADTLLDGGSVYFYSKYFGSLAHEAYQRRGGFLFAKALEDGMMEGTDKDCVIMGTYEPADDADMKNIAMFKDRGMRIGSIGPVACNYKLPEGDAVFRQSEVHIGRMADTYGVFAVPGFSRKVCPTSGILTTALLWELSSAIVEDIKIRTNGDIPAIYTSNALKWGPYYNAIVKAIAEERGY